VYNPQDLNRYSFELNNPIKNTDPTGHFACLGLCIGITAAVIAIAAQTSPYWGPYVAAWSISESFKDIGRAYQDPNAGNLAWGALGIWDVMTPGIPEGKVAKFAAKNMKQAANVVSEITKTAAKRGFTAAGLARHEKHVAKFGLKSVKEYEDLAKSFASDTGESIITAVRQSGDIMKYDKARNYFLVISKQGNIRTFFKPKTGYEYFQKQLQKYGATII
jgi:pyocin large subunit-like protein